jgi:hypothetical protein
MVFTPDVLCFESSASALLTPIKYYQYILLLLAIHFNPRLHQDALPLAN